MERERWRLVLSPVFVVGVILAIAGLVWKRLCKRRKPKDEESADIILDGTELAMIKNVPLNQHWKEGKSQTEEVSELDEKKIPLLKQKNNENERRSSPGTTGVYPNSAATSHTTSNKKSSVRSDSVNSGLSEWQKSLLSKPVTQEKASNADGASGQRNRTRSDRHSEGSSSRSRSSWNCRHKAHSDYERLIPGKKPRASEHEWDSISYSNELDTSMTSLQSGVNISSDGKRRFEMQNQTAIAMQVSKGFSVDMPEYPQQINATKDFEKRQYSREDPNKSSQRVEYNIRKQSDLSSSRAQYSAEHRTTPEDQPPERNSGDDVYEPDSVRRSDEEKTTLLSCTSEVKSSTGGAAVAYNRTRQSDLSSGKTLHSAEHIYGKKGLEKQNQDVIPTYVPVGSSVGSSVDMPEYDQQINTTTVFEKRQDSRRDPDRSSQIGERRFEMQNQTVIAKYVLEASSVDMPENPQQVNATNDFEMREDSREDPNKSSQRGVAVEYNITEQSDRRSSRVQYSAEHRTTPEGYEGQPPEKEVRTKVYQLDSIRHSNELDTSMSPLQSGFKSSSDGKRLFEMQNQTVIATYVSERSSVDMPEYPQQINATNDFEMRQDSREDPNKSSQRSKRTFEMQNQAATATYVSESSSVDMPENPQQANTTKDFEMRQDSREDPNKSSQRGYDGEPPEKKVCELDSTRHSSELDTSISSLQSEFKSSSDGDYEDLRNRATEAENGHTTCQSDQIMAIDLYPDSMKKMFLKKLMALDVTARNICSPDRDMDTCFDFNQEDSDDSMDSKTYNPLDVLCDVLHDSDTFLQQEIVSKMSMCQFALPLLLPNDDRSSYTFMLWAMRDIVKKWKPQSLVDSTGFEEGHLVNISMPIFSFFRLGTCSLSKSKILNQVLSPPQFIQNYFVHRDMPGGNAQRLCSDGLVEMSCYFPAGRGHSDIFPEPVGFINLRGDLESHLKQFDLLSGVSSAVFVLIESINDKQYDLLSNLVRQNPQFFFIVNLEAENSDIIKVLQIFSTTHNIKKDKFIVKSRKVNDTQIVKTLQSKMKALIENSMKNPTLEQIAQRASESNFDIDENFRGCKKAREAATTITSQIKNVLDYKKNVMKLQGDLWKQLTKIEKELCRMRKLEDKDVEEYQSQLREDHFQLRKQQRNQKMASGVKQFLDALKSFSPVEQKVFLKWLKIQLDKLGRHQLAKLNDEYRELLTDVASNAQAFMEIDQKLADGSLGVEHFIRELGQFYEVEHSIGKKKVVSLSKIAANLLLNGFPLELIDGDASNIPMTWITDVLSELEIITQRNCTVRVVTVLGVQSTGKSTLLNTMFGLHLPTSSGRCTRGAFMTLLDAKENFHENLGCDYVMVIDTEGLKSMELASLEGSYEHDNELATVAVGLSDITIINMAMENTEEMKDILQIVIHAFLRMKEVGKKSSCHFVHQNVSDVSAHVKNRQAREKFLEQLNEMTKVSARMENRSKVNTFSDIIHCDIESNSWYIPGLWHGIPPMASVNYGYSENVQELKKSIEMYLKSMSEKPQDIRQFTEWMRSLWEAVKHEKFVFSFRNRLVTEAYNQLCIQYSDWEWRFQKNSHDWMIRTETLIFNLSSEQLGSKTWDRIKSEMNCLLDEEERVMARSLEKYFMDDCDNAHLLEMFKSDFFQSIKYLRKNLEIGLLDKCDLTINIQKEKCQIQAVQERYIGIIEESVSDIMDKIRKNEYSVNEEQLNREFEMIWRKATDTLPPPTLKKRNIGLAIIQQLKRDMQCDDNSVILKLNELKSLNQYKGEDFSINRNYLQVDSKGEMDCAKDLALSVQRKCEEKVTEIANSKTDFNEVYSQELLKMINNNLNQHKFENLRTTKLFELDLKLWVLGNAVVMFQRMHEEFVRRNDPQSYLEEMKPQYFDTFINMFETRNECQRRAKQFCMVSLTPAILDHINRCLGKEIVDDILQKNGPREFKSRKILQREVLNTLLNDGSPEKYAEYINSYEYFMKRWISQYLTEHYKCQNTICVLQTKILESLLVKIKQALQDKKTLQAKTIYDFLAEFCNVLKKELVISQNSTKVVLFENNLSTIQQFAHEIELHLSDLEKLVKQDINSRNIETIFLHSTLKPQDELLRKVIGCGKQCPFCKVPCEAGGGNHKEHFASVHRPRGLAQHVNEDTKALDHSICSSNVISNKTFMNAEGKPHQYKDYQKYYPDWTIQSNTTADSSDYWKFVLIQFNKSFAKLYNANPANLPEDWQKLTREEALKSLNKTQ
ncbi:interferon-induced very large GTPase 1-like isoform X3 [Aquarana catesbeiana]